MGSRTWSTRRRTSVWSDLATGALIAAIGQWHLTGTFDDGRFQGIEPTGSRLDFRGIDVLEFEDCDEAGDTGEERLLRHNTIYYEGLTFVRQVDLLPAEDSVPDKALLAGFNGFTKLKQELLD